MHLINWLSFDWLPAEWRINLLSGIIIMIVEVLLIYLLIGRLVAAGQRRQENRKWKDTRNEFLANLLDLAANMTKPLSHIRVRSGDRTYVIRDHRYVFRLLSQDVKKFDSLITSYSTALAPEWIYQVAQFSDLTVEIGAHAEYIIELLPKLEGQFTDVSEANWQNQKLHENAIMITETGLRYASPDDEQTRNKLRFAQRIFDLCQAIAPLACEIQNFVAAHISPEELNKTKVIIRRIRQNRKSNSNWINERINNNVEILDQFAREILDAEFYFVTEDDYTRNQREEKGQLPWDTSKGSN